VSQALADALAERARAGIRVNVLLDGVGTLHMPPCRSTRYAGAAVTWSGSGLARFSVRRHNNRNHRRILVVDGRVGSLAARVSATSGPATASATTTGATPTCASKAPRSPGCRPPSSRTGAWRPATPRWAGIRRARAATRRRRARPGRAARPRAAATPRTRWCCSRSSRRGGLS
jgi:hypothetical protein